MESPTSLLAATAHHARPSQRVPRPRRPRRRLTLAALVALIAAAAAPAADADTRNLRIVTDGVFAADPAMPAKLARVSDDGSRVFFNTTEVMAATDTDVKVDAYLRAGTDLPVHLTDNPLAPDGPVDTFLSTISGDGTRAFFSSYEHLTPTDTDVNAVDAYERTPTGALVHLSDSAVGPDFNDVAAYVQGVTPDGLHAYFTTSEPLKASDTDASEDIYDFGPAGLVHVSDGPGPDNQGISVTFKRASDDGSRLYFETREKLLAADTDTMPDVYLRTAAGLVLVSDTPTGPDAAQAAQFLDVTPDGSRVIFETREALAATDTDTVLDVYERAPSGALTHITDTPTGPDGPFAAYYGGSSRDGSRVMFGTAEPMAPTDTDTNVDGYIRRPDGRLGHVTDGLSGPDRNVDANTHAISGDGSRVTFVTSESLAASDTDTMVDTYMRLPGGALVHVTDDPTGPDDPLDAYALKASADLTRVVVTTKERLAVTDTDTAYDVYERVPDGTLVHVSDDPRGPDADVDAEFAQLSADGRRVYFSTNESLSPADSDAVADAYVATLVPDAPVTPRPRPRADTTAPVLTGLKALPRRSRVRFRLSENADVRLVIRRRGGRARTVTVSAVAGANAARVRLRARGRYRVTAVAVDAAGNRSPARRIGFRVHGRR